MAVTVDYANMAQKKGTIGQIPPEGDWEHHASGVTRISRPDLFEQKCQNLPFNFRVVMIAA